MLIDTIRRALESAGLLHRVTRALAELDLDIRRAHVQTVGDRVADAFYVTDRDGAKVTDPEVLAEIERAVLYAVSQPQHVNVNEILVRPTAQEG